MAHANVIQKLEKLQTWANGGIGIVSRAAAIASLKDDKFVKECFELNAKARAYAIEEMEKLNIRFIHSHTNFIYFSLEKYKKDYTAQLEKNKILGPGIYEENGKWCRITVGTMEEMKKFISAIG